jgi:hypothetical protein
MGYRKDNILIDYKANICLALRIRLMKRGHYIINQ